MKILKAICLSVCFCLPYISIGQTVSCSNTQYYDFPNHRNDAGGTCGHNFTSPTISIGAGTITAVGGGSQAVNITWNPDFTGAAVVTLKHEYTRNCNAVWPATSTDDSEIFTQTLYHFGQVPPVTVNPEQTEVKYLYGNKIRFKYSFNTGLAVSAINSANIVVEFYKYNDDGNWVLVDQDAIKANSTVKEFGLTKPEHARFKIKIVTACKTYEPAETYIDVIPRCAYTPLETIYSEIKEPTVTQNRIVNGGYPNGGYEVDKGGGYIELGPDDIFLGGDYVVQSNNPTALQLGTLNTNSMWENFTMVADVGSYRVEFIKVDKFGINHCPEIPPLKLYVGGHDYAFDTEPCLIYLPQYLVDKKIIPDDQDKYILENFMYTMSSNKGIIVNPGLVLTAGALLKMETVVPNPGIAADDKMNYSDLTTYDDQGHIIGQARSYFDDRGVNIQTQVKNLSAGVILATETKHDIYDRPALTTLAAPVAGLPTKSSSGCKYDAVDPAYDMFFSYKTNFITAGGNAYSGDNFDGTKEYNPDAVDKNQLGTLGWYYSDNNKASFTHDNTLGEDRLIESGVATTSYPYSRTLYYNDGTNRPKSTTLPGDYHKAGSGKYSVAETKALTTTDAVLTDYLSIRNTKVFDGSDDNVERPTVTDMSGDVYIEQSTDMNGLLSLVYKNREGQTLISLVKDNSGTELQRSYIFYDDLGRMLVSISPNGYEQLHKSTPASYDDIDKTTYKYDSFGRLSETSNNDAGTSRFIYRLDGTLRFSQNAEQAIAREAVAATATTAAIPAKVPSFSYVIYDEVNRPVEAGVFTPSGTDYTWGASGPSDKLIAAAEIKGATDNNEDLSSGGTKTEVIKTNYDIPDADGPIPDAAFTIGKIAWSEKDNGAKTYFNYDEQGRITKTVQVIPGLGNKTIDYTFGPNGLVKEVAYQKSKSDAFFHVYAYDEDGRVDSVWTSTTQPVYNANGSVMKGTKVATPQAEYIYYVHGPLKETKLAGGVQNINYTYTAQGLLKAINNPKTLAGDGDIFAEQLEYFSGDYASTGTSIASPTGLPTGRYDGLPVAKIWNTVMSGAPSGVKGYQYTYDKRYQLKDAVYGTVTAGVFTASDIYKEGGLSYDANGNMLTLLRNAGTVHTEHIDPNDPDSDTKEVVDVLHDFSGTAAANTIKYAYNQSTPAYNNRMLSVPGYTTYTYNSIGQMTGQKMFSGNIQRDFTYNAIGLTAHIKAADKDLLDYTYDAGGQLLIKNNYDNGSEALKTYYVHDASGAVMAIYEKGNTDQDPLLKELPVYGTGRIASVYYTYSQATTDLNNDGKIDTKDIVVSNTLIYELKDHLGSTRARFSKNTDGTVKVESYADYYPYGLAHQPEYKGSVPSRNGFQGEYSEYEDEIQQNFFELRLYDPITTRWNSTDPKNQYPSPYLGMGNNPVMGVDPDGGKYNPIYDTEGNFLGTDSKGLEGEAIVMNAKDFTQGMDHDQAMKLGTLRSNMPLVTNLNILNKIDDHFYSLQAAMASGNTNELEHLVGPALIALGQPINALKPIGALGSKPGSSVASYTLSKVFPQRFTSVLGKQAGTKVATTIGTNTIGRALGRWVPYVGWAITAYDVMDNRETLMDAGTGIRNGVQGAKIQAGGSFYVCFVKGTLVKAKHGLTPIEKIGKGDSVYSYNFETNTVELCKVANVLERNTSEIFEITTNTEVIKVTAEHPFYVENKGWVTVKSLHVGDQLRTANTSNKEEVKSIKSKNISVAVYNIEVDNHHNYFVTSSHILVHNKDIPSLNEIKELENYSGNNQECDE